MKSPASGRTTTRTDAPRSGRATIWSPRRSCLLWRARRRPASSPGPGTPISSTSATIEDARRRPARSRISSRASCRSTTCRCARRSGFRQLGRHRLEAGTEWHRLRTHVAFTTFDDLDPFGLFRGGSVWLGGVFPEHVDRLAEHHARRRLDRGSRAAVVVGHAGSRAAMGLERPERARLAVAAVERGGRAERGDTIDGGDGTLHAEPGIREAAAGRSLHRPHGGRAPGPASRARDPRRSSASIGTSLPACSDASRCTTRASAISSSAASRRRTSGWRDSPGTIFHRSLQSTLPTAPLITSVPTNDSRGQAYGLDLFLSRADGPARPRLTGWVSYSLGKTEQDIYGRSVPFSYDRRHSLSVVWNWRMGSRCELAGTARAASGFPRTPPAGVRVVTREVGSRLVPVQSGPNRFALEVAPGGVARVELRAAADGSPASISGSDIVRAARADGGRCTSRASTC